MHKRSQDQTTYFESRVPFEMAICWLLKKSQLFITLPPFQAAITYRPDLC